LDAKTHRWAYKPFELFYFWKQKLCYNLVKNLPEKKTKEEDAGTKMNAAVKHLDGEFKEHSVAEFFKKNKQMLGLYGKVRTLTMVVHEYVSNSLDACEETGILPNIDVKIDELGEEYHEVTVTDNGPGISQENIGKAFGKLLAGTKFHRNMQSRGQQGIGACMKSDTLIPLADGRILPIKEIVNKDMIGEEVLSLDLETMHIIPAKISKCWKPKNPLFIKIKTARGREISLTPENPVLIMEKGNPAWIRADELEEGMKIAAPNKLPTFSEELKTIDVFNPKDIQVDNPELIHELKTKLSAKYGSLANIANNIGIKKDTLRNWFNRKMPNNNARGRPSLENVYKMAELAGIKPEEIKSKVISVGRKGTFSQIPNTIDHETAWIAGLIAGDGHLSSEKDDKWGVNITFTNKDKTLIDKYKTVVEQKFNLKTQQYFHEEKQYYTIQLSSKILSQILEWFGVTRGKKSHTFTLSNNLLHLNNEIISAYLKGLFDAEGSVSKEKNTVALTLYNKKALELMFHALLRLGIHASINKVGEENRICINEKSNLYAFYTKIGFSSERKQSILAQVISEPKGNCKTDTFTGLSHLISAHSHNLGKPLSDLPSTAYSAIHYENISRNSLKQVLQTVGTEGKIGEYLHTLAFGDVIWLTVNKIEFEQNIEMAVYDLEIEKYHNFVAGGIICHNSGCTMLSQMTTGKASKVITGRQNGKAISLELTIDPKLNEPKMSNLKELEKEFRGTAIQAKFKGTLYRDSDQGPLEYLRRTAIANPHAQISFRDPMGQKFVFKRTHNQIPERPEEIKPHPKGTTVDDVLSYCKNSKGRTVATFLSNDFDRMGAKALEEVKKKVHFDMNKDPKSLTWEESEEIIKAFKSIDFIAPTTDALRPIGEDQIRKSLQSIVQPDFLTVLTRKPAVYAGGYPFQVEIAIAYGGNAGRKVGEQTQMEIMRFANRVPLLFDTGNCALTKAVQTIDWKRYDIKDPETAPVTVFINFISVHIPYTGAGKQAIADEEDVLEEIRLALMQTGRKAGIYIAHKRREAENQQKRQMFYKYIPEITRALSTITKASEPELRKNMEKMVLTKLKLEEAQEAQEKARVDKVLKEDDNSFITEPKVEKKKTEKTNNEDKAKGEKKK